MSGPQVRVWVFSCGEIGGGRIRADPAEDEGGIACDWEMSERAACGAPLEGK